MLSSCICWLADMLEPVQQTMGHPRLWPRQQFLPESPHAVAEVEPSGDTAQGQTSHTSRTVAWLSLRAPLGFFYHPSKRQGFQQQSGGGCISNWIESSVVALIVQLPHQNRWWLMHFWTLICWVMYGLDVWMGLHRLPSCSFHSGMLSGPNLWAVSYCGKIALRSCSWKMPHL